MLKPSDQYFANLEEPVKGYMLFLRDYILGKDNDISEQWKYGMPFYFYKGKRICYLWVQKKTGQPYIGIVDGKLLDDSDLLSEKRSRMKILLLDVEKDIPIKRINSLIDSLMKLSITR
jgi:Domain of unknown function (DU1801)